MLQQALLEIWERDLSRLAEEINAYADERDLWILKGQISNTAGNLCLHLMGNLQHFIGATLGKTGYLRQRDLEFSNKNVPRTELLAQIKSTADVVINTIKNLSASDFEQDFPLEKHGQIVKTDFMILHLVTHFNYHLGQINYHRRLVSGLG